jgi:hypothetical protein
VADERRGRSDTTGAPDARFLGVGRRDGVPATDAVGDAGPAARMPARRLGAIAGRLVGEQVPRARFVVVVLGVLGIGLVGLLALNSALAADSFTQQRLARENAQLELQEQELARQIGAAEAPAALAAAARKLGLVPSGKRGFLILGKDGKVRVAGTAVPATVPPPPPKPSPPPPAPTTASHRPGQPAGTGPQQGSTTPSPTPNPGPNR